MDKDTFFKHPSRILHEDKIELGIVDAWFLPVANNKDKVQFKREEDMNYYRLVGRLREGIDCKFEIVE